MAQNSLRFKTGIFWVVVDRWWVAVTPTLIRKRFTFKNECKHSFSRVVGDIWTLENGQICWGHSKPKWRVTVRVTRNPCWGYGLIEGWQIPTRTRTRLYPTRDPHGFWNPWQSLPITLVCCGLNIFGRFPTSRCLQQPLRMSVYTHFWRWIFF
jgi:hypothetical protein